MLKRGVQSSSRTATFFRFACVGVTISVVDVVVLYLLMDAPGFNVYSARVVSCATAMLLGYLLNRYFTFHHLDRVRMLWDEVIRFFGVNATGALLNYAVFALIILAGGQLELSDIQQALLPLAAIFGGGLVGMCFNFSMSSKHVFDQ